MHFVLFSACSRTHMIINGNVRLAAVYIVLWIRCLETLLGKFAAVSLILQLDDRWNQGVLTELHSPSFLHRSAFNLRKRNFRYIQLYTEKKINTVQCDLSGMVWMEEFHFVNKIKLKYCAALTHFFTSLRFQFQWNC